MSPNRTNLSMLQREGGHRKAVVTLGGAGFHLYRINAGNQQISPAVYNQRSTMTFSKFLGSPDFWVATLMGEAELTNQNSLYQASERLLQVGMFFCFRHSSGCTLMQANFQNNIEETVSSNRKLQLYHFIFPFYIFPFCPGSVLTSQGCLANQLKSTLKR